jgi:hypothetical protein
VLAAKTAKSRLQRHDSARHHGTVSGFDAFPSHQQAAGIPRPAPVPGRSLPMNGIIYLVGLVVVVIAVLSFFGLR